MAASATALYAMVSDITRMGEWSPVCTVCEWLDADRAVPGATFLGRNQSGSSRWETLCRVLVARPGEEFAFGVLGKPGGVMMDEPAVRWGYTFRSIVGGTEVEESWELLPAGRAFFAGFPEDTAVLLEDFAGRAVAGMEQTLANLKRIAEASSV